MQQAGINKVVLYEDKGLTYKFYDADTICNLENTGETLTFTNCLTPQIDIDPVVGENQRIMFEYAARLVLEDYDNDTLDDLATLVKSVYGWKPLVYFYDGTVKFLDEVLKVKKSEFKVNLSMTINVELAASEPSEVRLVDYDANVSMSEYKADTTEITADSTVITADYF